MLKKALCVVVATYLSLCLCTEARASKEIVINSEVIDRTKSSEIILRPSTEEGQFNRSGSNFQIVVRPQEGNGESNSSTDSSMEEPFPIDDEGADFYPVDSRDDVTIPVDSDSVSFPSTSVPDNSQLLTSNIYTPGQFTDIPDGFWCAEYVKTAYEYGIMSGKTASYFDATGNLTIAQAIVMACRMHNNYYANGASFPSSQPWYKPYVEYALSNGIIKDGYEAYDIPVTRTGYARILSRALPDSELPEINSVEDGAIPDVSPDMGDYDTIYHLYRAGILTGNDAKGTFTPWSNISRGAAAAIISRMVDPSLRKSITLEAVPFEPVPINKLQNLKSLKKKCTDAEFKAAYDAALEVIRPLAKLSLEDQLMGIEVELRRQAENGIVYSMSEPHYDDPYGYFVSKVASCAGCVRATGLCLNMLGIPYEHVNEGAYSHQWARVNVNGVYWICDAYGLYCGPEPSPYKHPRIET